jgi:hypothetical protein
MTTWPGLEKLRRRAKTEVNRTLVKIAKRGRTITYSDLVLRVKAIKLRPNDPRLARLFTEISCEEVKVGRGMLSVLVVRMDTRRPGVGFFVLAEKLGRNVSDREAFWRRETNRVFRAWRDAD